MKAPKSTIEKAEMEDQRKPKGAEPENDTSAKDAKKVSTEKDTQPDGLDKWNDRLDENLESEDHGDAEADDNARDYSEKYGSGDQSDEN